MKQNFWQKMVGFQASKHAVKTEVLAGLTTFITMAYILAVNPEIISATGMDKGAVFTATALVSGLVTILMALYAKLPLALAPGMGLNAFFAYTVCLAMGYSWQTALMAVFIEGIIFILMTLTNLREKIVYSIPLCIRQSIGVGVGLFVLFLGMQSGGLVVKNDATMLAIGNIMQGTGLLCLIGLIITAALLYKKVTGALLYGIVLTTLIGIPMGLTSMNGIFAMPPSPVSIMGQFDITQLASVDFWVVVVTLLFVDMFDTIGTLVGVAEHTNMKDKDGKIPWMKKAFMVDAIGTTVGAMMGCSTVTAFVESTSGITSGGRTGLTSLVTGVCFLLSLFLAPLFLSMPAAATGQALILVGIMMMSGMSKIDFSDYSESVPAVICITAMAFTCSISNGIALGIISYVAIQLLAGHFKKIPIATYILAALFVCKFFMYGG
jgi:AGZA family xanthine/uracil permease-like MFS transporter